MSVSVCKRILLISITFLILSCTTSYKRVARYTNPQDLRNIIQEQSSEKYFIIHLGEHPFSLKNIVIDMDSMTLNGFLGTVDPSHFQNLSATNKKFIHKNKAVLNEIHLYAPGFTISQPQSLNLSLPLTMINEVEIIRPDRVKTSFRTVGLVIGVTVGVVVLAVIIAAISAGNGAYTGKSSSCPIVSVYDGKNYIVQGELFGGAVNKNLSRQDLLALDIAPVDGEYQLRISNELKERQFTDYADLIVLEHEKNRKAGFGTDGKIYEVGQPESPIAADLNGHRDEMKMLLQQDGFSSDFDDTSFRSAINELNLTFKKPSLAKKGKLVLELKNSIWLDFLYGQYASHFGERYNEWQQMQNKRPAEALKEWVSDQSIPMTVSMNAGNGWIEIASLNTIGPLAYRQLIVPFDLPSTPLKTIEFKLSSGFMFWEVDYAGLDFTAGKPRVYQVLHPFSAMDEKGNDVMDQITNEDGNYMAQPETGNYTILRYKYQGSGIPGKAYSIVLATSGYYEPIRDFDGDPDRKFLRNFRKPGELAAYSKGLYESIINQGPTIVLQPK